MFANTSLSAPAHRKTAHSKARGQFDLTNSLECVCLVNL
jgi:hypothetical protein